MASKTPIRSLLQTTRSSLCPARLSRPSLVRTSACAFSTTTPSRAPEYETEAADRPRWQQTPPRMVAPFRTRPLPRGPVFHVNDDPRKLDDAYVRMLGPGGDKMLSEEVKWLAVTHKSFDHGRRGFNDRLAFLGKRIISLQTSQALLSFPPAESWPRDANGHPVPDKFGRSPFIHPALANLASLTADAKDSVLDKKRLSGLAERYGLDKVTRWKPKRADNLQGSGIDAVLMTSLYAIVGAIALERGGEVANKVTQDKILAPLGFTFSSD
ncbi:hypothetical protein K458DRAFT_301320 [Lentithecium fluviatile CBS 122367]|uniref:RNase III domain-containing protein n=1 Tax=Lentithecium fluviatile CBS 122367 TaxID=1168545 RepID=A0A6G1J4L6_9PLEO|nr:hypothetical protein K458DRAFT_301320 [Lentithecium fluviatile CBS 122367]